MQEERNQRATPPQERDEAETPQEFLGSDAAAVTGRYEVPEDAASDKRDEQTFQPAQQQTYAGFWIRVGASLIDSLFLLGVSYLIFNPIRRAMGYGPEMLSPVDYMEMVVNFLYMILLTWWTGQTLGKMLLGIRVVSARQGDRRKQLTLGQVLLREVIGKLLSAIVLGLGYLWVAWNPKKQGWHDLIAKTYVIHERKRK
jgi:uncharacterized RDD family membrane protein YckC